MLRVAVVIPYFQRQSGLLRRGLETIYAQDVGAGVAVDIVVVDDESPSPPELEITGFSRQAFAIRIVKQANGGPAKARNSGLDHACNADYIAFLDSDDWWMPSHLSTALAALGDGAGFYFANNIHEPGTTLFQLLPCGDDIVASAEPRGGSRYRIASNTLLPFFKVRCVAHTSSIVIDATCIRGKRFDEEQAKAGEDHLFWLEAVTDTPYAAFCLEPQAERGHGIDLDRGAYEWDNPESIRRLYYNLTLRKKICALYSGTEEERRTLSKKINRQRREILHLFARNFFVHAPTNLWVLAHLIRHDLAFFPLMPYNAAVTALQRLGNRLDVGP